MGVENYATGQKVIGIAGKLTAHSLSSITASGVVSAFHTWRNANPEKIITSFNSYVRVDTTSATPEIHYITITYIN